MMRIFNCRTKPTDSKFCFVSDHISPFGGPMSEGTPLTPVLERMGKTRVDLDLDEDRGGLELPDLVGGRLNYLVIRNPVAAAIEGQFNLHPYDTASVALINRKKRVQSSDYRVINPHGQIDCIDPDRSDLSSAGDKLFVKIFGKYTLRAAAIPSDRDIFRVKGLASGYMFSERLVNFIQAQKYTNFEFGSVTVS